MSDKQCPCCLRKSVGPIHTWRRNTQYHNSYRNYLTCCYHCIEEDDFNMHWDWQEYYYSQGWGSNTPYRKRNRNDWERK